MEQPLFCCAFIDLPRIKPRQVFNKKYDRNLLTSILVNDTIRLQSILGRNDIKLVKRSSNHG